MKPERLDQQNVQTYRFEGRLDAHQIPKLKSELEPVTQSLHLDLAKVNFIDSTGLAFLVGLCKKTREQNLQMKISNLQDPVRLILEITGLYSILPIENNVVA